MKRKKSSSHYIPDVERLVFERSVRMDMATFYKIKGIAITSGKPLATCMREILKDGYVRERLTPEHADMVRKLIGMATNLNQVAHRANAAGYASISGQCSSMVADIQKIINEIKS